MTTGPTITTTTVLDVPEGRDSVWFQVQDGAYPPSLGRLIDEMLPARGIRRAWRRWRGIDPRHRFAVLAMGQDAAEGKLHLDKHGRAALAWRNRWQAHLYRAQGRVGPVIARGLGARVAAPLSWSLFRRSVTVHALGGVPTGGSTAEGVVDDVGQLHGYDGLYVVDGAAIPAATGVNPSATILAAAERALEHIIRDAGHDDWRAPEWPEVSPAPVPEDAAFAFMARRRASTAGNGVTFAERMRDRTGTALTLTARIPSIDRFLADPAHAISVSGSLARAVAAPLAVDGTLSLFPNGRPEAMVYTLRGLSDGAPLITGVKIMRGRTPWGLVRGLTTLRTTISSGSGSAAREERVLLNFTPRDLARLFLSMRGQGFTGPRRARALARFAWFFAASALHRGWSPA